MFLRCGDMVTNLNKYAYFEKEDNYRICFYQGDYSGPRYSIGFRTKKRMDEVFDTILNGIATKETLITIQEEETT